MKNFINLITKSLVSSIVLVGVVSLVSAWDPPPPGTTPPDNNVSGPISTSTVAQTKAGPLTVGGLISTSDLYITNPLNSGTLVVASSSVATGGFLPGGLKALIGGKIGATEYCNENGGSCVTTENLGGGTLGTPDADSGWVPVGEFVTDARTIFTFKHNLGTEDYFVFLEAKFPPVSAFNSNYGITHYYYGGYSTTNGFYWRNKQVNTIDIVKLFASPADFRVRLWKISSTGGGIPSVFSNIAITGATPGYKATDSVHRELNKTTSTTNVSVPASYYLANASKIKNCYGSYNKDIEGGTPGKLLSTNWPSLSFSKINGRNDLTFTINNGGNSPSQVRGLYKFTVNCVGTDNKVYSDSFYIDYYPTTGTPSGETHSPDY